VKISIIGKNSFIGSSINNYLKDLYDVTSIGRENIVNDNLLLQSVCNQDVIINCVGSANVSMSFEDCNRDFQSNFLVVQRILEVMRKAKLDSIKFLNISSAAVYGNPIDLPIKESTTMNPISPYGFHKQMTEILLKEYSTCFNLKTISLRIFSAYGNGQKKLLLWDLHNKFNSTNSLVGLYGTGNETRDFIHVEDVAEQILLAVQNAGFNGEAINVANGNEIKIADIVELYLKFHPKKSKVIFNGEVRLGDPMFWCADISTMKNWGYQQKISIEDGIAQYIEWATKQ
jgi:UDP-glucose 4-epimerase